MAGMQVTSETKQAAVSVVVTRANGAVEDLGVVAYYHRNPLRRLVYLLKRRLGFRVRERDLFTTSDKE